MSEQYDEQPVDRAGPRPARRVPSEEVLTDPETGETVASPLAEESVELGADTDDLDDPEDSAPGVPRTSEPSEAVERSPAQSAELTRRRRRPRKRLRRLRPKWLAAVAEAAEREPATEAAEETDEVAGAGRRAGRGPDGGVPDRAAGEGG